MTPAIGWVWARIMFLPGDIILNKLISTINKSFTLNRCSSYIVIIGLAHTQERGRSETLQADPLLYKTSFLDSQISNISQATTIPCFPPKQNTIVSKTQQ